MKTAGLLDFIQAWGEHDPPSRENHNTRSLGKPPAPPEATALLTVKQAAKKVGMHEEATSTVDLKNWGTDGERLLKAKDIQRILGVGRTKAYEMMASGELPVIRVGDRSPRVPVGELKKWLAQRTTGGLSMVA